MSVNPKHTENGTAPTVEMVPSRCTFLGLLYKFMELLRETEKEKMVKALRTVVPSSKGPHGASILRQCNGMGAPARHLSHVADVFHQCRNVSAVAVTVTCNPKPGQRSGCLRTAGPQSKRFSATQRSECQRSIHSIRQEGHL